MNYHCISTPWQKGCGGFLKFWEEIVDDGRIFHCDCNKCGRKIEQFTKFKYGRMEVKVVAIGERIYHGMEREQSLQ